jgi:hypothetical protein
LTRISFIAFFNSISFFFLHPSILSYSIIEFYNFIQFAFKCDYPSIMIDQIFCILTQVCSDRVFCTFFNYIYFFLYSCPSTFVLLKIELQLFFFFSFFFLWSYYVLIWFVRNCPSNFFFHVFLSMGLSQSYIHCKPSVIIFLSI